MRKRLRDWALAVLAMAFLAPVSSYAVGAAEERDLRLRAFVVHAADEVAEVASEEIGTLVRRVIDAERQSLPSSPTFVEDLIGIEGSLLERMRTEPGPDPAAPPLMAIWPVACVLVSASG